MAELPAPPPFGFRNLLRVIGPGAILAATSIGGGEWLVGPAVAVKYSASIFLICTVAIALQVVFNLEAIRYTLYTGEPIYGGIMRLWPGPRFWAVFYTTAGFFQLGWPALAGSAAATLLSAWTGRLPEARDSEGLAWIATVLIALVVLVLFFGGTIERMLEYFAWTMLSFVFGFLLFVNIVYVSPLRCCLEMEGNPALPYRVCAPTSSGVQSNSTTSAFFYMRKPPNRVARPHSARGRRPARQPSN